MLLRTIRISSNCVLIGNVSVIGITATSMASKIAAYSVDKHPASYDKYSFTLPELYRQIAKDELREDDAVRERSLTEMRQWIVNNPHIRKCRTDAKFLLRFLRLRQFSVPMACEALERYLAMRELYPGWYKNLDCNDAAMKEIFKNGPMTYLGQDSVGRAVVLIRFSRFEDQKFRPVQDGRFMALFMETLLEIEEVQIGGCQVFIDYAGCTVDTFEKWSATELKIMMEAYNRSYPLRYGEIHAAQLAKFGCPIVDMSVSFANPKLREKIRCYSTVAEMEKYFDPDIKPKEYGGTIDLGEMSNRLWKRIVEQRQVVVGLDRMEIDVDYYALLWEQEDPSPAEAAAGAFLRNM
ncbi:retinaldehyde-binding protein 1-like [Anopheles albimanus]|uniref:retinaldehyde-binding protein 1-like n=1 Tax=Anopheles albimanus TaxID=7167 RepID=UPI00163FC6AA|nr:retinaldehyde-binding protein 1-like [Anopheles albimanus]